MLRKKTRHFSRLFFAGILLASFLHGKTADAQSFRCETNEFIEIDAADDGMLGYICTASEKALGFLGKFGLRPKRLITVRIVERNIDSNGYIAFGSYDRTLDVIELMSYPAIMSNNQSPQMYDQPFDIEHYQGAIAHEITHAVFQHNVVNIDNHYANATQEYLAHATQLGVLSADRRREIIAASNVGPWESGDSIGVAYMGLNPTGFAVKSYLHLTQLDDPQPFIKILLNTNWFYVSVP